MLLIISTVTFLIVPVLSRYHGDQCDNRNNPGICTPLSQCEPLVDEINAAGSPMPMYMRRRLQELGCGFASDEPLVCCIFDQVSPITNKPTSPEINIHATWDNNENTKGSETDITSPNLINPDIRDINDGLQDVSNHPNLYLLPKDCGTIDSNRILGGNRTQLYEMPWMVVLSYDEDGVTKQGCGGTLINERYVLTAAHCVQLGSRVTLNRVILGEYDLRTDPDCEVIAGKQSCAPRVVIGKILPDVYDSDSIRGSRIQIRTAFLQMTPDRNCALEQVLSCAPKVVNATIEEIISHPGYRRQTLFDDIALIRLAQPADFNSDSIGPICLPSTRALQRDNLDGLYGIVAGWGITEDKVQSPVLLSVGLPIITNKECQAAYKGSPRLYSRQLCAGGVRNKDSCGGDSGGPLMYPGVLGSGGVRYVQRGLVSFGPKRCGIGGLPGVYTRISYYMKWILDNMRS